jgi:NAD(P)-dependent dehydrogenase (short-subunit alcohol dehydrogenase family)
VDTFLDNRVAIVTGGAAGIGAAYAQRLSELGATVVIADLDGAAADQRAKQLEAGGGRAAGVALDISQPREAAEVVDRIVKDYGSVDVLVNNAGMYRGFRRSPAEDIELADWGRMLDVNISGTFYMCRAVIPHMRRQRSGRIINQTSTAAFACRPMSLHYSVSKAALIPLTKVLARELAEAGITVNSIAPGFIDTEATAATFSEAEREAVVPMVPMKRAGTPADLTGVVEFLCSPASAYMTGQTLVVDGGMITLG